MQQKEMTLMLWIQPKPLNRYPFYLRWFFRRQKRKYGKTLSPSWLWGRVPAHFGVLLLMLGLFERKRFQVEAALRSLVSVRVAQLNGCAFCVDLNAYNLLKATGSAGKAEMVERWRESALYSDRERAALDYTEAIRTLRGVSRRRRSARSERISMTTVWLL
jgi:AhpD family alkylhydroperoxidase